MDNRNFNDEVSRLIQQAIESAGLSKNKVAADALIAHATFERKLKAGAEFKVAEIHRIARVLGVPYTALLPEQEVA